MRGFRHILIMMILCPWIGGTIIGYSAYLTTKVTDLPSALSYLFTAAVGVLLFGLLLTCVAHVLFTSVSYGAFLLIHHTKVSTRQKFWWICGLSFVFAILEGMVVLPIARDIKAPDSSVIVACMVAGSLGAWLNSLNWLPHKEFKTSNKSCEATGDNVSS